MASYSWVLVLSAVLLVVGGCGSGGESAEPIGASGDAMSEVSAGGEKGPMAPESTTTSTAEGGGYVPEPVVGPYDELVKSLLVDPEQLIHTGLQRSDVDPDPSLVVVRVGRGALSSTLEAEFRAAVPDLAADARVFVFDCPFTRAELDEFLAYQRSGEWKDEGSKAIRVLWPQLVTELLWGGIADCVVFDPIDCLSEAEIEAISAAAARLNVSHLDLRGGARLATGYDPDTRFPPGVSANADPECTYRSNQ